MQSKSLTSMIKKMNVFPIIALLAVLVSPSISHALTPIARWDTVPYQRINNGEAFNIGVVAFSKAGIERVDFHIQGQGYSGSSPLQSTAMVHNSRTNVYEYWVPLNGNDFATDGPITVQAIVYGKDGDQRDLGTLSFVVNATGTLAHPEAWVSNSGNNDTGAVNNRSKPFQTVAAAVSAVQAANGGRSDGATIYFFEGSYTLGNGTVNVSNEWLTLSRDSSASKENTIIDGGGGITYTNMIRVDGMTLRSSGSLDYIFSNNNPSNLWISNCRIVGPGRWVEGSNPITVTGAYFTDTYITKVDRGVRNGRLARGLIIEQIGEDVFQNFPFAVNIRVNDQDPGSTYWHADGYQSWGDGPENRIIYNYYGTNMHYQGLFLRATNSAGRNNAFVNIFMEMREPGRPGYPGGSAILSNGAMYGPWDHVLVWHCTFPSTAFSILADDAGSGFTNSSFIGNLFWEFRDYTTAVGSEPSHFQPGNAQNNDFLYNHFIQSYTDVTGCTGNPQPAGCPHWYSKSPDSLASGSQSVGDDVLSDLAAPASNFFGYPQNDSILMNRVPFSTIPADVFGKARGSKPDIGAIERKATPNNVRF